MMMRRVALLGAALFYTTLSVGTAAAQEPTDTVQEVRLVDGSTLFGTLLDDGDPIRLRLLSGDLITIARARVRSIAPALGTVRDGELWRRDPNLTRLFFSPTGRTMPKKTGYIAAYELVFPFVAVGLTDAFLIAGGTPLFGSLTDERVVYLAPKLRLYSDERTDFAVGAFHFEEIGNEYSDLHFGALYAVLTRGTSDRAISLAVGAAYDEHDFYEQPAVMLGGEFRVSRTIKLITENYFLPEATLLSVGPRFFGERLSADLGIGIAMEESEVFTLPIVNFIYTF